MKARKRLAAVAAVMVLAVSAMTVNAVPAFAEETGETVQTEASIWNKYEPCNELEISGDKLGGSVIAGKMTKHQPVVIWSKDTLTEDEQKSVWESLKGNPGVGNPSGVVYISGDGASMYGMTVDTATGKVIFDDKSNWSLLYTGEYKRNNTQSDTPESQDPEIEDVIIIDPEPEILPEKDPDNIPDYIPPQDPEPEKGPGVDVTEEPDNHGKDEIPTTPVNESEPSPEGEYGSSSGNGPGVSSEGESVISSGSESGAASVGSRSSGGSAVTSGSSIGGPGAVHELDDVPETGLLDKVNGRSLDEVPKTGMPEDFMILMGISAAALVLLTVVLVAEKNKEKTEEHINR